MQIRKDQLTEEERLYIGEKKFLSDIDRTTGLYTVIDNFVSASSPGNTLLDVKYLKRLNALEHHDRHGYT